MKKREDNRILSYDILRILSIIGVILMHVTYGRLYGSPTDSGQWTAVALLNGAAHFGVPVFVMISGALFLNPEREMNLKRLWTHTILRLAVVLLVWNVFYGVKDFMAYNASPRYLLWEIVDGRPHLWFLPMIMGLYAITPLLLCWLKNAAPAEVRYILWLFFGFCIVWETLIAVIPFDIVSYADKYRQIPLVCGYAGYYILGYYVIHVGLREKTRKALIAAGAAGLILGQAALVLFGRITGEVRIELVDSYSVFTFFYALGLFLWITGDGKPVTGEGGFARFLSHVGQDTFGVYLCHIALLENLPASWDVRAVLPAAVGELIYALMIFLIGTAISALIRRIPVVGRYLM